MSNAGNGRKTKGARGSDTGKGDKTEGPAGSILGDGRKTEGAGGSSTGNSRKRAVPASSCRGGSLQGKSVEVPKKHEVVQWGQEGLDASLDFLLLARFFFWFFVPRKLYVLMLRTLTVFRPGPGCSHQRSGIEGCQQGTAQTEGMVRCLFVICILPQTVRILAAFFHSRGFSEILGWSAMGSLEDSFYQRSCECFAVQSY